MIRRVRRPTIPRVFGTAPLTFSPKNKTAPFFAKVEVKNLPSRSRNMTDVSKKLRRAKTGAKGSVTLEVVVGRVE